MEKGETTQSPCIDVCRINPTNGFCEGCYRTLDEIAAWSRLDEEQKTAVIEHIEIRRKQAVDADAFVPTAAMKTGDQS